MKMNRATLVEMRKSLELVEALKQAGIRFVPVPVFDDKDHAFFATTMARRLEKMERIAEGDSQDGK